MNLFQTWVTSLPLRHQGVLSVALRGCDLSPKYPLDSPQKNLTSSLRGHICNAFDPREIDSTPGCFMSLKVPEVKLSSLEHYPMHWVVHIIHAVQLIGLYYPDLEVRNKWWRLYLTFVDSLHMSPEEPSATEARLTEDRIASGNIVQ